MYPLSPLLVWSPSRYFGEDCSTQHQMSGVCGHLTWEGRRRSLWLSVAKVCTLLLGLLKISLDLWLLRCYLVSYQNWL